MLITVLSLRHLVLPANLLPQCPCITRLLPSTMTFRSICRPLLPPRPLRRRRPRLLFPAHTALALAAETTSTPLRLRVHLRPCLHLLQPGVLPRKWSTRWTTRSIGSNTRTIITVIATHLGNPHWANPTNLSRASFSALSTRTRQHLPERGPVYGTNLPHTIPSSLRRSHSTRNSRGTCPKPASVATRSVRSRRRCPTRPGYMAIRPLPWVLLPRYVPYLLLETLCPKLTLQSCPVPVCIAFAHDNSANMLSLSQSRMGTT